jgi:predicted nucleotidyltransferase
MLEQSVLMSVRNYLAVLNSKGITIERAVVFGSRVRGQANDWSDIDLLVISPQFDGMKDRNAVNLLWRVAARTDSRIEPIPCGSRQWRDDDSSAIIEIARREGEILELSVFS